jgi:hypothetical protein
MSISWEKEEEEQEQERRRERQRQSLYESPCRSEQQLQQLHPLQQSQEEQQSQKIKKKIKQACSIGGDIPLGIQRRFFKLPTDEDRALIADFIIDCYNHQNIAPATKQVYVSNLVYLSRHFEYKKAFRDMSREDIISDYLNSLRRPVTTDSDQKWINTHNQRAMVFSKFFKWMTQPDLRPEERQLPPIIKGLRFIRRRGPKTHVKPTDLWTLEDDALFLKYCEDPRLACYHTMSRDTSARPGELLAVKIGDVKIKKAGANNKMFAEVEIGRYGKVKKSRIVPLIDSLPYFKAWLAQHPMSSNPQAHVFISHEHSARYRNTPLRINSLRGIYLDFKYKHFPKLIPQDRADVPPEDKIKIKQLLQKPFNPYLRRHSSLSEKARLVNEYTLRQHAGWTKNSDMIEIYTHELGGESSEDLLLAYGIDVKKKKKNKNADAATNDKEAEEEEEAALLQPKTCPHCSEPNKPASKFCVHCHMVLTFDAFGETIEEAEKTKKEFEQLKEKHDRLEETVASMLRVISGLGNSVEIHGPD